jgi:hypothetical protein
MEQEAVNRPDALTAFEMLLGEIDAELEHIRQEGARAFESGDLNAVRRNMDVLERLRPVRRQVVAARDAWRAAHSRPRRRSRTQQPALDLSGLAGERPTPGQAYVLPILRALERLGGSGTPREVLDVVAADLRDQLKPVDLAPINSDPTMPRWRKAAQWCRYDMVNQGLLRNGSPRGVWEISEQGRRLLEEQPEESGEN